MRSNRKAFLSTLLFSVFITTIFILSIPAISFNIPFTSNSVTSALGDDTTASSLTPGNSFLPKVASEEETIDSFDVNAKSGRWDVTDSNTDDSIQSSNLRVINSANSTSDSSYFAQRGLVKSDSKVEFRAKSSVYSNESEYFRDQLGDSADFDESDTENFVGSSVSLSTSNGYLTITPSGTPTSADVCYIACNSATNNVKLNAHVYNYIQFEAKINSVYQTAGEDVRVVIRNDIYPASEVTLVTLTNITTDWQTFTISLGNRDSFVFSRFRLDDLDDGSLSSSEILYINNFQYIGSYDYATTVNGGPEDTFDFEDSKEYSYDVLGNITNFDDGTTEGMQFDWFPAGCASDDMVVTNNGSNYLQITVVNNGVCDSAEVNKTGLSISASTYNYFAVEVYSNTDLSNFVIYDGSDNLVYTDTTNVLANTWHLYSGQIVNAAWSGTETAYKINLVPDKAAYNTSDYVLLNMVYFYDSSLGDVEGFSALSANAYHYVDPTGYLQVRENTTSTVNYESRSGLSIDSSIFRYLTIRFKADSSSSRYFVIRKNGGQNLFSAITGTIQQMTSSFQTIIYDLSLDADWTGTITQLYFNFYSSTGFVGAIAGSLFTIDYILLTANAPTSQEPFTLGFWDQDNSQALVNITQSYINTSYSRFEVEIYDSALSISAYYYSSYYALSDIYFRGKISYNIQKSLLAVELLTDGQTRLFKADYPDDFTVSSDTNAFFSIGKAADIFFNSKADFISASETWIDFINVPYKEREWVHSQAPIDTDWITDTRGLAYVQDDINDFSEYRLHASDLDAVSAILQMNASSSLIVGTTQSVSTNMSIYNVDTKTGGLVYLTGVMLELRSTGAAVFTDIYIFDTDGTKAGAFLQYENSAILNPYISFIFGTLNDRSGYELQFGMVYDTLDSLAVGTEKSAAGSYTKNLTDISFTSSYSNEYVIVVSYDMDFTDDIAITATVTEFSLTTRDIFGDIYNVLANIGGSIVSGLGNIFTGLFNGLIEVLRSLWLGFFAILKVGLDGLGVIFTTVGNTITSAITSLSATLGGLLTTISATLSSLASDIATQLTSLFNDVVSAVAAVGAAVWDAFGAAAVDFVSDVIAALASLLTSFWNDVILPIINEILGIITTIIDAIVGAINYFIDEALNLLPFGLGAFLRGFNNLTITDMVNLFFDIINWLLNLAQAFLYYIMIFCGFYIFGLPLLKNLDKPGNAIEDMIHNAFAFHGFDFAGGAFTINATVPVRVNAILVWLFCALLLGYLTYLFPFSLF